MRCKKCGDLMRGTGELYKVLAPNQVEPEIRYFYCEKCNSYQDEKIQPSEQRKEN